MRRQQKSTTASYDVIMLVLNDIAHDGRVRNEAAALATTWRVLVVGTQRSGGTLPDRETVDGYELRRIRYWRLGASLWQPWRWIRHLLQAWQILRALSATPTCVYHAHDLPALILLTLARRRFNPRAKLVYDAHELFLFQSPFRTRTTNLWHRVNRPLSMWLEGKLAQHTDGVLGLAEGRARLMARWYGVHPVVIQNAVDPVPEDARAPVDLQTVAEEGQHIIVHTGEITNRRRAVSELVKAIALLPEDVTLVFLGKGESCEETRRLAAQLGIAQRVFFLPPVPPEQVAATIRTAHAAAILMRAESWNTRAGQPNKLYEAIGAGVPVVASDMFVLRRLVQPHGLGVVCDPNDPGSIADALKSILSEENQEVFRKNVRAAQQVFNWQTEMRKFMMFYQEILA
ncbi:MAG: glycosyltransferase family 4 protein [Chloroflexi bacterium]|nr:glycosyltransferase family 4 protein [Chloroflexota bacterium]